jgi:hypothetical protein
MKSDSLFQSHFNPKANALPALRFMLFTLPASIRLSIRKWRKNQGKKIIQLISDMP